MASDEEKDLEDLEKDFGEKKIEIQVSNPKPKVV
jgi:hypothetical protein